MHRRLRAGIRQRLQPVLGSQTFVFSVISLIVELGKPTEVTSGHLIFTGRGSNNQIDIVRERSADSSRSCKMFDACCPVRPHVEYVQNAHAFGSIPGSTTLSVNQVLRRESRRCQFCGTMSNLEVHHKEFRSHEGEDSREFGDRDPLHHVSRRCAPRLMP